MNKLTILLILLVVMSATFIACTENKEEKQDEPKSIFANVKINQSEVPPPPAPGATGNN